MSSHEGCSHGATRPLRGKALIASLFDVDEDRIESLSWSLGHRVTVESDATRLFALDHRRSNRSLTAFEATDYTCILRLQTPIGREKFYGVAKTDLPEIPEDGDWVRTD
ncbi:hypothetical protein ACFOZ7_02130 [Natribaculum luteum]|uniref:Uncharacterized protein n=1 Tax=Natribaculum luteum TaxID=1586232 RepID=A0ABD5NV17_9EURY|nr:hypothetical protein [Natribaculum luteum]